MKKTIPVVLLTLFLFCGCSKLPTMDVNKRCYETFSNMTSFTAEIKVTANSNTNSTEYTAVQYYKSPDRMRTESQDLISVVNGRSMCVKNAASPEDDGISARKGDCLFLPADCGEIQVCGKGQLLRVFC